MLQEREDLGEHELYVANFYFQREKYKGTIRRANYLLTNYSNLGLDTAALLLGAQAHLAENQPQAAQKKLNRLLKEFSSSPEAKTAQELLQSIPKETPKPS